MGGKTLMRKLVCALFVCSLFLGGCCHHKCVQKDAPEDRPGVMKRMHDGVMKADASFRENAW